MLNLNEIKIQLKKLFIGYRKMTKVIRNKLKELGFLLIEGGKHYKIYFIGIDSLLATISKTPSDFHVGNKIVSNIMTQLSLALN